MSRFELHVAETSVSSGTVSVGWCVSPELLKELDDMGLKNPQVVLVVTPDQKRYHPKKEYRQIVPLKDLIGYVEFRCAGSNRIWGFIADKDGKKVKSKYLSKDDGEYDTTVIDCDGHDWSFTLKHTDRDFYNSLRFADPLPVEVPAECFAPEPSEWEKNWVNRFFRNKCVDQCEFRRRRLFAYTVQPFIALFLFTVMFIITLASAAYGSRGFSLQPLKNFLSATGDDLAGLFSKGSYFIRGDKKGISKYMLLPFMPIIFVLILFLGYLLVKFHVILSAAKFLLLVALLVLGLFSTWKLLERLVTYFIDRKFAAEKLPAWYLDESEAKTLMCAPGKKITSLSDLPKERRTLKLRFLDLKSKVCRPFSA